MTARTRRENGEMGPETIARMSTRDLLILCVVLLGSGAGMIAWVEHREERIFAAVKEEISGAVTNSIQPLAVQLTDVQRRLGRIEDHEDDGWSVRGAAPAPR